MAMATFLLPSLHLQAAACRQHCLRQPVLQRSAWLTGSTCRAFCRVQLTQPRSKRYSRVFAQETEQAKQASTGSQGSDGTGQEPSSATSNLAVTSNGTGSTAAPSQLPTHELTFQPQTGMQRFVTSWRLIRALPWRRFKKDSVLVLELDGEITEQQAGRFAPPNSIPQICEALRKAAYDPRVKGVYFKLGPLSAGWAKLLELRRYIKLFRQSGKFSMASLNRGGEKEYFLAAACEEVYIPPTANLSLRGFAVAGTFLRGVLDKIGVEPQVKRIGNYKSAGDQLLRRDMSEYQREQLTALLEDIQQGFLQTVAQDRGKTPEQVQTMLDEGIYDMQKFVDGGWVTALKYEDELMEDLKKRTGGKPDQLRSVSLKRYAKVSSTAFAGLTGKKVIAVMRTSGAIVGGEGGGLGATGSAITAGKVIKQLRALKKDKRIAAVVLRIDSGGGDALASDLMWREIQQLAKKKPIIASMGDVAASGGYYMAMGAQKIVAEALTITGSIGVVTGKFNLSRLYDRVQYNKEIISRGRYAELLGDNRSFTPEEQGLFDSSAEFAYESFRDKAAESRGMSPGQLQQYAQGRVWSGMRGLQIGLVDAIGGLSKAVALAKEAAGIDAGQNVRLVEVSQPSANPLAILSAATISGFMSLLSQSLTSSNGVSPLLLTAAGVGSSSQDSSAQMVQLLLGLAAQHGVTPTGRPMCVLPVEEVQVHGIGSQHFSMQKDTPLELLALCKLLQ